MNIWWIKEATFVNLTLTFQSLYLTLSLHCHFFDNVTHHAWHKQEVSCPPHPIHVSSHVCYKTIETACERKAQRGYFCNFLLSHVSEATHGLVVDPDHDQPLGVSGLILHFSLIVPLTSESNFGSLINYLSCRIP